MPGENKSSDNLSKRNRFRFSLLSAFFALTAICVFLGWWAYPGSCTVEAIIRFRSNAFLSSGLSREFDETQFAVYRKTHAALIQSEAVLSTALSLSPVVGLPIIVNQEDPVKWLQEHLEVDCPPGEELVYVRLRGYESSSMSLVTVMDSIIEIYQREVVYRDRSELVEKAENARRRYRQQRDKLRLKTDEAKAMLEKHGQEDAELKLLQREIEMLSADTLALIQQIEEMEATSQNLKDSVQIVQPPYVVHE